VGETRVDLQHLLEDLRDAYTGSLEETILTDVIANALDSGATRVRLLTDAGAATLSIVDDGRGMQRRELARYHDIAASTKQRGQGIGFPAWVQAVLVVLRLATNHRIGIIP
jgi:nitrogen fixation/metabolism regulation signal transduction histidine kinase